ncbi:MAG: hypothetical protein B7Z73_18925, partial [Planctomycetia bacterium 21-64-5]
MDRESTAAPVRKLRGRLLSLVGMLATVGIALLIRHGWPAPAAKAELPFKRTAAKSTPKKKPKSEVEAEAPPAELPRPEYLTVMAIVMSIIVIGLVTRNFSSALSTAQQIKTIEASQVAKGAM